MTSHSVKPLTAADVRDRLTAALDLDLVGPGNDHPHASEVIPIPPSRWYLTGFLAPRDSAPESVEDFDQDPSIESAENDADEATPVERAAATRVRFPASMGLSVLVGADTKVLRAVVQWGDYTAEADGGKWKRQPREQAVDIEMPARTKQPLLRDVPHSGGLQVAVSVRPVAKSDEVAKHRVVSLFVVNNRHPAGDAERDVAFAFQVRLEVHSEEGFVARPNLRGQSSRDGDERIADLQYRDVNEWAVGHGVATEVGVSGGRCHVACTCWVPCAEVERVEPSRLDDSELRMQALAELPDAATAAARLMPLVASYREWISAQQREAPKDRQRAEVASDLMKSAQYAAGRIEAGILALGDPQVLQAFTLANKVMAVAARQRDEQKGEAPKEPTWRPFQLAFVLVNLPGIAIPTHRDRELVDLLFFPTGGGKTEAYLGLAAFTLVYRRLANQGIQSAGLSVLMRYTLRLLTLDQLSRAATLVCALELERQQRVDLLGPWPFEVGLWVGRAATPNRMGRKGDNQRESARAKVIAHRNNERKASPVPLENCPWCGTKFTSASFRLWPREDDPTDLHIVCVNRSCLFTRDNPLPILAVDEPIYRRLPCFLIATVDKFASMPWVGEVGGLFGRVDRCDRDGFYGPSQPGRGRPLPEGRLPPPDLIIQDELHLISGPLGTIAGLYESALDWLASRKDGDVWIRPKIVASTATVRRAESQVRALFGRQRTEVFPPLGPDRRDSFFARTVVSGEVPARRYLGVAAQGRSLKVVLLRTCRALLSAAQKLYEEAGGKRSQPNVADAYMTLLGYFNSLRELGGSRRIVEDEVGPTVDRYSERLRGGETVGDFADRSIAKWPVELTSRVPTNEVSEAKRRLARDHHEDDHVDVALATNMISVGLDITRLGLMVVLGQPKTSAEYIQATSRVGRDRDRPGLVVTLLNVHRPRDRSHYERFGFYHETFYRSVEASSVTPFSPRALDRALVGAVVSLARQGYAPMTAAAGAGRVLTERGNLAFVVDALVQRACGHGQLDADEQARLGEKVRTRVEELLDAWNTIANDFHQTGGSLQYGTELGGPQRLLFEPQNPELRTLPARRRLFRANRSMRDVEASVNLWVKTLDNEDVVTTEGEV